MAISVDSTSFKENGTNNLNTLTWSHTIGSGSNRILIVYVPISQNVSVTGVTYGGVSLTQFVGITNGDPKAYIYYLLNPTVGTANCVITFNTSIQYLLAGVASFFNVNQTIPLANGTTKTGTASNKSMNITCTYSNSYILECLGSISGVHSAGSGQTLISTANRLSAYDSSTVQGTNSQSWTTSESTAYAWVACELVAAKTGVKTNWFM